VSQIDGDLVPGEEIEGPDGHPATKYSNATVAENAAARPPLANGRHRRRAEASIDTRTR
jgi:hypothetical protein